MADSFDVSGKLTEILFVDIDLEDDQDDVRDYNYSQNGNNDYYFR